MVSTGKYPTSETRVVVDASTRRLKICLDQNAFHYPHISENVQDKEETIPWNFSNGEDLLGCEQLSQSSRI